MSQSADPALLVPRTCTTRDDKSGERESRPLADFRAASAYVLLGDPGAGKTSSFEHEAAATGGYYVRARSFATLDPNPELSGKTLFIDGLDEMRAGGGDGRTPLDYVRRHLDRLGRPRFRLSCREADWYGDSDRDALLESAPGGSLTVLHLDPLSDADIGLLLERRFAIADPVGFIRQADHHGLSDLLRNPQTLALLARTVGTATWPGSRTETYDLACRQLVREANPEHRAATRANAPTPGALVDAAGFLCSVHLLAGLAGFALDDDAADGQHLLWRELSPPCELPLSAALTSGVFQRGDREQQRIPAHRSVAEFLGARYLAKLIDEQGLPLGRVIALLAGEDGGIVPDLRGLTAWLTVHCHTARSELVERDPLGAVLYGDVRGFPTDDKRRVLAALEGEAERYPHFRFEDWTAAPFGALATPDMVPVFLELLALPSRSAADIALLDCALDALQYGPPPVELASVDELPRLDDLLYAVARDATYPSHIRHTALTILLRDLPRNAAGVITLARELHAGTIEDGDDQLIGLLLTELFPRFIGAEEVFDFLHPEKQDSFIGDYHMFWSHRLQEQSPIEQLPELLAQLAKRGPLLRESLDHFHSERMAGALLTRALETYGDTTDDAQLYDWLGTGLDQYEHPRVSGEHQQRIASWLAARPDRYKAIFLISVKRCLCQETVWPCLFYASSRLYGAEPLTDIVPWFLERAADETHAELKQHFFVEAAGRLIRQGGREWLTSDALDYLGLWVEKHPEFEHDLELVASCPLDHWRRDDAGRRRTRDQDRQKRKEERVSHFREHLDSIRDGTAHPRILHDLAQAYLNLYVDIQGETPRERLEDFLGGDEELIEASYNAFRRSLDRDDLPSMTEIIDLDTKGQMHFIRQPCLIGIEELYGTDPMALSYLDDEVLRRLIAFRLTWPSSKEADWFTGLVKTRPELVAKVLVAYALPLLRRGREHVHGVWELAYNEDFAAVARIALPDLLQGFPLRAKTVLLNNALDPLLKAGLRYLDHMALATIISARLTKGSMTSAQRIYWLACGLMIAPDEYEKPLAAYIGASKALRGHLGAFFHGRRPGFNAALRESSLALLIELLAAPDIPPERPSHGSWVSPAMQTAEVVRGFINALGGNPTEVARQQLERLLALPQLAPWHARLRHAAHTQRIARRKASVRHIDATEVCRTLANREPANAGDLAALTYTHLQNLARKIRDGSTNDYRQYWSFDARGKPERPKPENDCRDALLSDLRERLGRLGVDAIGEGYYVDSKRADIRVSSGGATGFNVPIEIKRDSHRDLWRAMHEQLIELYVRDSGADGFGIYVVFWFGGKDMPLPQEGKKPRNAAELEQQLSSTLTREEARYIAVCVIDCALP